MAAWSTSVQYTLHFGFRTVVAMTVAGTKMTNKE
jgi:hypothetical protein